MNLTKNEIEIAERCISKREKQLGQWPYKRWMIVVFFSAMAILGYRTAIRGEHTISEDRFTDRQVSEVIGNGPPAGLEQRWVVGTMLKINKVLEARHQLVSFGLMEFGMGYVEMILGLAMVCIAVLRWNTGERGKLICKLLRMKLQEIQQQGAREEKINQA